MWRLLFTTVASLEKGRLIDGPAIVEDPEATVVVPPGMFAEVSRQGHLVIKQEWAVKTTETDPFTLTVVWNPLLPVAEEMGSTLRRTAFSEAVREGDDFSTGVFDAKARLIAQGNFPPGASWFDALVIRTVLEYFQPDTLRPGDAIFLMTLF
ncbi:MAG: hypothetical protein CM1200mP41_12370 [Gammaproteobacteria bacterium]|nr:MAG: hypothetical protein CM1200mP41_12370 [Gammaproteobacteria bacterium]